MMKRAFVISLILLFVFLVPIIAYASPLEITPEKSTIEAKPNTVASFKITIKNNQVIDDKVIFFTKGENSQWRLPGYLLLAVESGDQKTIPLDFLPKDAEPGTYNFNFETQSFLNPHISAETDLQIKILPDIIIKDFTAETETGKLIITLDIKGNMKNTVFFKLKNVNSKTVKTSSLKVDANEEKEIQHRIDVSNLKPGTYTLYINVKDQIPLRKTVDVKTVHAVSESIEKVQGPTYDEYVIAVTNNGNVVENNYRVKEELPDASITGFVTLPTECYNENNERISCDFIASGLEPGMTANFVYRIVFWPEYMNYVAATLIIIFIAGISAIMLTKPRLVKRHIRKDVNKYSVILEVKNPFWRNLKNVVVRDWVSPLAKVLHKDFDYLKPVMRRSDAGTELLWRLGDMKPREHRILNYKINTLVEGNLKMPKASFRYHNNKGKKIRRFSKSMILD